MSIQEQQTENTDKKDDIIVAAQKCFGQMGFRKTSMIDIAKDLSISKALLYYYFPDKEHLYNAVVHKEIEEFKIDVANQLNVIDDPAEKLRKYVCLRLNNFRSLLNLGRLSMEEFKRFGSLMHTTLTTIRHFENQIITGILIEGNERSQFNVKDVEETANLLFDLLRGMRMVTMKDKPLFYLDQNEYESLVKKIEIFMDIFIQGINNNK